MVSHISYFFACLLSLTHSLVRIFLRTQQKPMLITFFHHHHFRTHRVSSFATHKSRSSRKKIIFFFFLCVLGFSDGMCVWWCVDTPTCINCDKTFVLHEDYRHRRHSAHMLYEYTIQFSFEKLTFSLSYCANIIKICIPMPTNTRPPRLYHKTLYHISLAFCLFSTRRIYGVQKAWLVYGKHTPNINCNNHA